MKQIGGVSKRRLDPRMKLLLVLTMSTVSFGGGGRGVMGVLPIVLTAMVLVLFLLYRNISSACKYGILYAAAYAVSEYLLRYVTGAAGFLVVAFCGIFLKMMPVFLAGSFLIGTTKVNEFNAAMQKMHITDKIAISVLVMFRFFPTLNEEYQAIGKAMRMRGIRFGGKHPAKMIPYRLIPLLMSSVRIGEELSAAALTRGLGAPVKRTSICEIGFGVLDIVMMVVCFASLVLVVLSGFHVI